MRISIPISLLFIASSLALSCNETDFSTVDAPVFHTAQVDRIDSNGVQLYALVSSLGSETIVDHGFQWNPSEDLTNFLYQKSLGPLSTEGEFSHTIVSSLREGQVYFCRAYVETLRGIIYYTNLETFTSKGSRPPEITNFSPKIGHFGTEVTLLGKNFSPLVNENILQLGDRPWRVLSASDTVLRATMQRNTSLFGNSQFSIRVAGKTTYSSDSFFVQGPVTTGIFPNSAATGMEVVIRGENFDPYSISPTLQEVRNELNKWLVEDIRKTDTTLRFIVPRAPNGEYDVILSLPTIKIPTNLRLEVR